MYKLQKDMPKKQKQYSFNNQDFDFDGLPNEPSSQQAVARKSKRKLGDEAGKGRPSLLQNPFDANEESPDKNADPTSRKSLIQDDMRQKKKAEQ